MFLVPVIGFRFYIISAEGTMPNCFLSSALMKRERICGREREREGLVVFNSRKRESLKVSWILKA